MLYESIKKLGRACKPLLHRAIAKFVTARSTRLDELNPEKIRRILIIRQHNEIGDLLVASPTIRAFKQVFPRAKLEMIVRPKIEAIARGCSSLSRVIVFNKRLLWRRPWRYREFMEKLRNDYDIAVVLSNVSVSTTSALFAWLSRAPYCVGRVKGDIQSSPALRSLFNVVIPRGKKGATQIEKNLDFLRCLVPQAEIDDLSYDYQPTKGAAKWASGFLRRKKRQKLLKHRKLVFIHPGAGKLANRWPAEKFAALADGLIVRGCTVLVDISPGDEDAVEEMLGEMRREAVVVPLVSLPRLAALIARCDLFIGNDTGIFHLAAAVGTRSIGLFGPTNPGEWMPAGERVVALRAEANDLCRLAVSEVSRLAVRELLKK